MYLIKLADKLGPYVCMVKVHADIVKGFNLEVGMKLKELATKHNYLIFEDRYSNLKANFILFCI